MVNIWVQYPKVNYVSYEEIHNIICVGYSVRFLRSLPQVVSSEMQSEILGHTKNAEKCEKTRQRDVKKSTLHRLLVLNSATMARPAQGLIKFD